MAEKEGARKISEAHVVSTTPDVCLTPMGSEDVPVPYPIVGTFVNAVRTVTSVLFTKREAFHMSSRVECVQGNEAGTSGGVVSGVNKGACRPLEGSPTVKAKGELVVRHGDQMEMNCAGPDGAGNTKGKTVYVKTDQKGGGADGKVEAAAKPKAKLTDEDYERAAKDLGVDKNSVKAVANVEASGDGFLANGQPKVRFEGHFFHRLTDGKFDADYPTLSYAKATGAHNLWGVKELGRVQDAAKLDSAAAMMSTSWGKFQIMGEYFKNAGFSSVDAFVSAMGASESAQLDAFVDFIKSDNKLLTALQDKDWSAFARRYNGPGYAKGGYDTKMQEEYEALNAADGPPKKAGGDGIKVTK